MLAAHSEAYQSGRNPSEEMDPVEQPQNEGNLVENCPAHNERGQDAVVNGLLDALDDPRRE